MAIQDLKASLDFKQNLNVYITCKQFDNLNLILNIFDNSVQANLTGYNVRLRAMKSDQVPLIQEHTGITISNNVVTIVADEQLTNVAGDTPIELQFIDSTGKKKATFNLVLRVVPSVIAVSASISTATYTLLEELENKLDQATDYFENVEAFQQAHPDIINLDNRMTAAELSLLENTKNLDQLINLKKRLSNSEITKIKIIGDSNTEGYGVIEHTAITPNTNNGNPIIFTDGTTTYYEADYTSRCFTNYFRQYLSTNFPSVQFVNAGIGGKTAKWANENKQYWIGNSEDVLIINLGTNDKYPETLAEYTTYMTQLLAYAKTKCNLLIVCTPVYAANDYVNGVISPANKFTTDDMEKTLSQICATNGYIHISLLNGMKKLSELYDYDLNQMVNIDLVHLNLVGHYIAWNVFQKEFGFESDIGKNVFQNDFSQILIDGNFQVAQLVPTINTNVVNPNLYIYPICDMWKIEGYNTAALPNITHTRKLMDGKVPCCKYFYRINADGAIADGQYLFTQIIKNGISKHMNGKEIINFSFWARSNITKKLGASFYLKFGTGGSPSGDIYTPGLSQNLTSEWTRYSSSLTLDLRNKIFGTNDDDYMTFRINVRDDNNPFAGAGYIDIANILISTTGPTPKAYSKSFEEELQSCMRYLEKSNEYNVPMSTVTPYTYENSNIVKLKAEKVSRPTISLYSWQTGTKNNIAYVNGAVWSDSTSFTLSNPSTKMFDFNTALTNYRYNYVADARP